MHNIFDSYSYSHSYWHLCFGTRNFATIVISTNSFYFLYLSKYKHILYLFSYFYRIKDTFIFEFNKLQVLLFKYSYFSFFERNSYS